MTTYKKVGSIDTFGEIPWGKPIIVTGTTRRGSWKWRMPGVFEKINGEPRFRNECGMSEIIDESYRISLDILEIVYEEANNG